MGKREAGEEEAFDAACWNTSAAVAMRANAQVHRRSTRPSTPFATQNT